MEIKPGRYKTSDGSDAVVLAVYFDTAYGRATGEVTNFRDSKYKKGVMSWMNDGKVFDGECFALDLVEYLGE